MKLSDYQAGLRTDQEYQLAEDEMRPLLDPCDG